MKKWWTSQTQTLIGTFKCIILKRTGFGAIIPITAGHNKLTSEKNYRVAFSSSIEMARLWPSPWKRFQTNNFTVIILTEVIEVVVNVDGGITMDRLRLCRDENWLSREESWNRAIESLIGRKIFNFCPGVWFCWKIVPLPVHGICMYVIHFCFLVAWSSIVTSFSYCHQMSWINELLRIRAITYWQSCLFEWRDA